MPRSADRTGHPLGRVQATVLRAIEAYVRRYDRPPTVREIGQAASIASTGHLTYVLEALQRYGHITWERKVARGIHLTRAPGVPILGTIAAGQQLDLFDTGTPETLDLAAHARASGVVGDTANAEFALCVRGDSMIEEGIFDGDYVLVRPADEASEGAIVVAVELNSDGSELGAATLKRFRVDRQRGLVLLCPANAALHPIEIPIEDWGRKWRVQGTVAALYRPYD
jgi:repressor LexA